MTETSVEDQRVRVRISTLTTIVCVMLASAVTGAGSIWGAAWWMRGGLATYTAGMERLSQKFDTLAVQLVELKEATYTLSRASEVALRQAIENPGSRVVDPRDPNRIITVRSVDHSGDNPNGGR